MVALGRILFVILLLFLLLAALLIGGSIGGFLHSYFYMKIAAVLVILLWGIYAVVVFDAVRHAAKLAVGSGDRDRTLYRAWLAFLIGWILSIVTGLGLAFLSFVGCGEIWIPNLYHWAGFVGAILGLVMHFMLPWIIRMTDGEGSEYAQRRHLAKIIVIPTLVALLWGGIWLGAFLVLRGGMNVADYKPADRVYKLPFPEGESSWVIQGNNSSLNHKDSDNCQKYSWDFRRPCDTPVLASRAGTVIEVVDSNEGRGGPNNKVLIDHGGGVVSHYLHIETGSAKVKKNDVVKQGTHIANVGSVGNSLTGHIHFMVKKGDQTIAVSFTDVSDDNGIPRTFSSYTSGNKKP